MKTTLRNDITVAANCDGFVYNQSEGKGLFGLGDSRPRPEGPRRLQRRPKAWMKGRPVFAPCKGARPTTLMPQPHFQGFALCYDLDGPSGLDLADPPQARRAEKIPAKAEGLDVRKPRVSAL